jgi:hypothetical protein
MDTADGTYMWENSPEVYPDSIVQLFLGNVKVLTNSNSSFVGGLAIVKGSEKYQVAGLELTETFLFCGMLAQVTHIKNIVIFFHPMPGMQVASGKFSVATGEAEIMKLESKVCFLQVKATMSLQVQIVQLKAKICKNQRQIAHDRLKAWQVQRTPTATCKYLGEDTR